MGNAKEVTIYDLAKELNVSTATISRAINGSNKVKQETRKLVMDAVEKRGFRINNFAQNIRTGKTRTIGVIVHVLNSNFTTSVLSGIEKIATQNGYDIIIGHSDEDKRKEVKNTQNLFNKRVDGLLASLAYNTDSSEHYEPFVNKKIPLVFFDRVFTTLPYANITLDNYQAGYKITEHLIKQGCRKIMHITADISKNVYLDRLEGFKAAHEKYHTPLFHNAIRVTTLKEDSALMEAKHILNMKERPDAVFVANDFCAAIIMNYLIKHGVKIPEEIAFAGFNDDPICKIIRPNLTTIKYSGKKMGEIAAQRLFDELNGTLNVENNNHIVIKPTLIVRESSMKSAVLE